MNVQGSVHWKGVYSVGECRLGCKFFLFIIKGDQSKRTKSHMFDTSLKFTNHKCDGKIAFKGKMLLKAK